MKTNRRNFLAAAGSAPLFVPRAAWGANDKITYALIGSGGRGRYLNERFQRVGAQCVALCDVYDLNLKKAAEGSPAGVKTTGVYEELLADKSIDAVVLGGPTHQHLPMVLASLKAGKDIYTEKPLTRTLQESQIMIAAVEKSDRIVQVGMQRRSVPEIIRLKNLVDEGILGWITMVKAQWNWSRSGPLDNSPLPGKLDWDRWLGNAPKRPLEPMRFRTWRSFRDYEGGQMTDQGTHLMDVVQWFTGNDAPKAAVARGFVAKKTGAEHPEVFSAVFEYPKMLTSWSLDYCCDYQNGWKLTFMGDEATLVLGGSGYSVWASGWGKNREPLLQGRPIGSGTPTEPHIKNFLDCMKSRKQPNSTVREAAKAVAGPILANIALFGDRRAVLADELQAS